ncbi:MAG: GIY-YIG nuclease family protein [Candidatus Poribacteria bacterium]|nr:GIY-YIG nuclease family protein [Candidatus Poribacteria bacterium]
MHNQYEYVGQHLVMSSARELILEFFSGKSGVPKRDMIKKVETAHIERGGTPHTKKIHPVSDALDNLKNKGLADNPNTGFWDIKGQPGYKPDRKAVRRHRSQRRIKSQPGYKPDPVDRREYPTSDKIRKGSVYFYYFPTAKENAELKGENKWAFKIGCTEGNPQRRIDEQRTGMSEEPIKEAVIYTESPRHLEQIIHDSLKKQNMHIQDAPGTEWFLLSPDMVKKIKEAFEVFEKSLDFQSSTQ